MADMPATIIPVKEEEGRGYGANNDTNSINGTGHVDDGNNLTVAAVAGQQPSSTSKRKYSINSNNTDNSLFTSIARYDFNRYRRMVARRMQDMDIQLFLGVVLLLSLFVADAWVAGNASDSTNDAMNAILLACFIVFGIEMLVCCFVLDNYLLGMMFWLDAIGTVSLILDISWIADTFLPSNTSVTQGSIVRTTRIAKLAARFGRLLRLIKLMKFIKFLPCFGSKNVTSEIQLSSLKKVTEELSNLISTRVAMLLLVTVIVMPFLSYDNNNPDTSIEAWMNMLRYTAKYNTADLQAVSDKFVSFYNYKSYKVVSIDVKNYITQTMTNYYYDTNRDDIRADNIYTYQQYYSAPGYTSKADKIYVVQVEVDATVPKMWEAKFGIIIVCMILMFLFMFTALLQSAVDKMLVGPLDHLMTTLRDSATAMLRSMKAMDSNEEKSQDEWDDLDAELETALLEKMVEKLSRIVQTMAKDENVDIGKDVDPDTADWLTKSYNTSFKATGQIVQAASHWKKHVQLSWSPDSSKGVDQKLLNSWDLNVLKYTHEQLYDIVEQVFTVRNCVNEFNIPLPSLRNFVKAIGSRYLDNSYHNFKHGCDVFHTADRLIQLSHLYEVLSSLEIFSIYIGSLGHDVGHPGVNNPFLVTSKHHLALLHNDASPLENMHCSLLYEIMTKGDNNIMVNLTEEQWRGARKTILAIILGTDMAHHFEQIKLANVFLEVNGQDTKAFCKNEIDTLTCLDDDKNRLLIVELVLHCSDISNPFKPFDLCQQWANLIVIEFGIQGDREKEAGVPVSPMMDREQIVLCNMQMGFIEYVVAPLIIAFVEIFPSLYSIGINMRDNYSAWGDMRRAEILGDAKITDKDGERAKIVERIDKFNAKLAFCDTFKTWPTRPTTA